MTSRRLEISAIWIKETFSSCLEATQIKADVESIKCRWTLRAGENMCADLKIYFYSEDMWRVSMEGSIAYLRAGSIDSEIPYQRLWTFPRAAFFEDNFLTFTFLWKEQFFSHFNFLESPNSKVIKARRSTRQHFGSFDEGFSFFTVRREEGKQETFNILIILRLQPMLLRRWRGSDAKFELIIKLFVKSFVIIFLSAFGGSRWLRTGNISVIGSCVREGIAEGLAWEREERKRSAWASWVAERLALLFCN